MLTFVRPRFLHVFSVLISALAPVRAATFDTATFKGKVQPFLEAHCFDCHDRTEQKGGVRLDTLEPQFGTPEAMARWTKVFDQVRLGEMPPKKKARPPQAESRAMLQWIGGSLLAVEAEQRKREGGGVVRRLNRVEYENSVRELLGIETELQDLLPEDASLGGFDNVGAAMYTSPVLMERYLDAADKALDAATANRKQPETKKGIYRFEKEMIRDVFAGYVKQLPDAMVFYGQTFTLTNFKAAQDGVYRIRVRAASHASAQPVQYSLVGARVFKGGHTEGGRSLGFFDAAPGQPTTTEFTAPLRAGWQLRLSAYPFSLREASSGTGKERPGVAIYSIEIEGPIYPQWPPESHRRLYGDLPLKPLSEVKPASVEAMGRSAADKILTPVSSKPEEEAERIVRAFLPRAFRHPVAEEEAKSYVAVALDKLKAGGTFEEAVRLGIKTALCSPAFLFLPQVSGRLDAHALASRLSYFLWSSTPDEELRSVAEKGTLSQPAVLRAQVERLLRSPKAREFTENFTGQWLGLREIDATAPDILLYPEFDGWLRTSMLSETKRFFDEVLAQDLSVANFIDSDFAMLNGRLAAHYKIPGVAGLEIRKVPLPAGSHRGGVLTQGAILKITANGTVSSPVVRGAWVMRNIIGKPVPPPPEAVPAIEPDIRGAKTIREQLSKHRDAEGCASCHNKMDPLGFALENFDPIGGWREKYRILGAGVKIRPGQSREPTKVVYQPGSSVECAGSLTNGAAFKNIDELKKLLVADPANIARCLTEKLLVYSTGHPLGFTDRVSVEAILTSTKPGNYGFRSLIHAIVQSETFLSK